MPYPSRLGGADFEVTIPSSLAERYDVAIAYASGQSRQRVAAATVGLCWTRFRRRVPYTGDVLTYGGRVIEELCKSGPDRVPIFELSGLGIEIAEAILLTLPEIADAAPFSAGAEAPAPPDGAEPAAK
jgi:hypothetical protein